MSKWEKELLLVHDTVMYPLGSAMPETEENHPIVWINQSEDASNPLIFLWCPNLFWHMILSL